MQCWETDPLQPFQLQTNIFFSMALTVFSNTYWHSLCNYLLAEHGITQLCSSSGNGSLSSGGIFSIMSDGSRMIFKYHILMDIRKTLKFWNNKPAKRITMMRHRIMGIKN